MNTKTFLTLSLAVLALAVSFLTRPRVTSPILSLPPPSEGHPGEYGGSAFNSSRERWMASMMVSAPDVDPRQLDNAYRTSRMEAQQQQLERLFQEKNSTGPSKEFTSPAISGLWIERGSNNQAGRTNGYVRSADGQLGFILSAGGNLWKRNAGGVAPVNDSATFHQAKHLEQLNLPEKTRTIIPTDYPFESGVYFSDNDGQSFHKSQGLSTANVLYTRGVVARPPFLEVYLLRLEYNWDARAYRPRLWVSVNSAGSFADLGFLETTFDQTDIFSPRDRSNTIYLVKGAGLFTIGSTSQSMQQVSQLPFTPAADDSLSLAGGVTQEGRTFLYLAHGRASSRDTQVWRSLDGGVSFQLRGSIPERLFHFDSIESSNLNQDVILLGGVEAYRSLDGGLSFTKVNGWGDYYASPIDRLHADIMDIDIFADNNGIETTWISTDGGTYKSSDYAASVQNISLSGLNVGQYYSTVTRRSAPYTIMVGSQDQGYQRAPDASPYQTLQFSQPIGGDYGSLTSSDGGKTVWMSYPGFAMVDTRTDQLGGPLPRWDFRGNGMTGNEWIPAMAAVPGQPNSVLVAGGRFAGTTGHQLVTLTLGIEQISHVVDGFVFPEPIGAVSFGRDNSKRFVLDTKGAFWTSAGGAPFQRTEPAGPGVSTFRGTDILVNPEHDGQIYVSGSGYSNSAVFMSADGGRTFIPLSDGLPQTLVYRLAASRDGRHLFAAASTGAFYFDATARRWVDLVSAGAPNQPFLDVEYVDELRLARFATYGRGIWDFAVGVANEPRLDGYVLPTPNPPNASCPAGFFSAVVDDGPGAGLTAGAFGMELLLNDPGTRVLAGGLNFGGLIDAGQVGFAGFTIANAANENQRLSLNLTGSPSSSSSANLPVRVRISRRPDVNTSISVLDTTATVSLQGAYTTSLDLAPGFYEATVAPTSGSAGGSPEGQFYFSLTTSFIGRPGGGFQGGAVVGGYHATHPFGGVSGFAAFCLATPHSTSVRVLSQPSYGPTGAKDLRLRIQDAQQRAVVVVPTGE